MTTDEFIAANEKKLQVILKDNQPLYRAVANIMALQSKRIFIDGKNADGGAIGTYKGGEMYASKKVYNDDLGIRAFPLKGKSGSDTFKNKKKHKSGYFTSYSAFKKQIGLLRGVQSVDLFLTGTLHRHWANNDSLAKAEAIKVNQNFYKVEISDKDMDKVERYPRVFNISASEKDAFLKTIQSQLALALK